MSFSSIPGTPSSVGAQYSEHYSPSSPASSQHSRGLYATPNYNFPVVRLYESPAYYGAAEAPQFSLNQVSQSICGPFDTGREPRPLAERVSVHGTPVFIPFVPYVETNQPTQVLDLTARISFIHSPASVGPVSLTPPQLSSQREVRRQLEF